MIRFSHEANSWQVTYIYTTFSVAFQSDWMWHNIDAKLAREYFDSEFELLL